MPHAGKAVKRLRVKIKDIFLISKNQLKFRSKESRRQQQILYACDFEKWPTLMAQ